MPPVLFFSAEECCACRACSNVCPQKAITFIEDKYGFWFPRIDESLCVGCGQCEKVCNFHNEAIEFKQNPIKGYAAMLRDEKRLKNSASGGVFIAVAEWVILKRGCVFGCVWDADMNAVHVCAETMEQVYPMQGSKYVQSNVGNVYKEVKKKLEEGRHVLFTGTPCQVAGLKSFLGNNKEYEKLITMDLVCHGVPNNTFFHQWISYLEKQYNGKVIDYHFRHKRPDWLNGCNWVKIKRKKRTVEKEFLNMESPYFEMFNLKNYCCRQSCSNCKYACSQRVGDITMGDFWGFDKLKIKLDYNKGLSCMLLNSDKALSIVKELDLNLQEVPVDAIINGNSQLRHPYKKDEKWDYVMEASAKGDFNTLMEKFKTDNASQINRAKIKRILPPKVLLFLKNMRK